MAAAVDFGVALARFLHRILAFREVSEVGSVFHEVEESARILVHLVISVGLRVIVDVVMMVAHLSLVCWGGETIAA